MNRILLSLVVIGAVAAAVVGGTQAFFSDTETSTGNTISAGSMDLKIGNQSYYNREVSGGTSWTLVNALTNELFFNFSDVKPDDEGEDTIELQSTNASWACMRANMTQDDDISCTDSELEVGVDPSCAPGPNTGELDSELQFAFWGDDGDNVLEVGEKVFAQGAASTLFNNTWWTIADNATDAWETTGLATGTPIAANISRYVAKAWCYGTLDTTNTSRVAAGSGVSPVVNPGVGCDGVSVTNSSQTDQLMANVSFYAVQARNNGAFTCGLLPL